MTYTDKQIRAFLREVKLEAWAESTPHIRGVGKLLEALREPTVEMKGVAHDLDEDSVVSPVHDQMALLKLGGETLIWQAMLDARMGEG